MKPVEDSVRRIIEAAEVIKMLNESQINTLNYFMVLEKLNGNVQDVIRCVSCKCRGFNRTSTIVCFVYNSFGK